MNLHTPPPPVHEYRVEMVDNRVLIWSACDLDHLLRSITHRGYRAKHIMLLSEYEAEQEKQERAIEWNWRREKEVEEAAG